MTDDNDNYAGGGPEAAIEKMPDPGDLFDDHDPDHEELETT